MTDSRFESDPVEAPDGVAQGTWARTDPSYARPSTLPNDLAAKLAGRGSAR
jgi:hypothetical protein